MLVATKVHVILRWSKMVYNTSRKHGKKELQSFSHCGSFDHPNMQSLNDIKFVFLGFTIAILKFWGHVIHHWKGIFKTSLAVY
jgi:hypothetical protein